MSDYVRQSEGGGYRVGGTRVSLSSVVHQFRQGATPEAIVEAFPVLGLEQVYGAITFYLAHREEIDRLLAVEAAEAEEQRRRSREADPAFYDRFAELRRQPRAEA
jgi:uncharacterized protein (DUF433 family)